VAQVLIELPDELVQRFRAEAERLHVTTEELIATHIQQGESAKELIPPPGYYASLWGAAAGGAGAHGSVEAVDHYVRELRKDWDPR